jgi:hypothetical protein
MPVADVLILTNGPGEVATWVRPVVAQLHRMWGEKLRISVVLSPCPHSTGEEPRILERLPGVARVQAAKDFWPFLLWGRTAAGWDWLPRGLVMFLGGDPFYALVCGWRLRYPTLGLCGSAGAVARLVYSSGLTASAFAGPGTTPLSLPSAGGRRFDGGSGSRGFSLSCPYRSCVPNHRSPARLQTQQTDARGALLSHGSGVVAGAAGGGGICVAGGSDAYPDSTGTLCRPPIQSPHSPLGLGVGYIGTK